jgi:hypothetical protein
MNTQEKTQNNSGFPHVYVLHEPDTPEAKRILQLQEMLGTQTSHLSLMPCEIIIRIIRIRIIRIPIQNGLARNNAVHVDINRCAALA